ncbi:hypothetical protein DCAR_0416120 [Daucus carota subsp. sativus]|uniref:Cytochrome P450 n=1 Tax=Daucus carota subsp. sativus TaxID=79200 RepID=A0AAF0WW62_DAUCS|nr:hypothetical protein DCAR_0416120 [Daucus carota subsp. sativus]
MDIAIICALYIFLAFTLLSLFKPKSKSNHKLPPGPYPLPIIGNIHKLGKNPHRSLADLAQVYGPIMRLKLGQITTIVISSSSMAQQVLQKQDAVFANRPVPQSTRSCDHNKYSVAWLPVGSRWRSLRKILKSHLFTAKRLDENRHLRSRKCSQSGEAVDIGRAAFLTTLNFLSNTIFSKDMTDSYDNSEAKEFRDLVWNILVELGNPNMVDFFPIPAWIDPQGIYLRITGYSEKLIQLFDGLVNERSELKGSTNFLANISTTDMLDELLKIEQTNEIDKTQIRHLFMDLFVAGTDTTSSTVEWAMSEILRNPETLLKAKAELNQVIGKGKIIGEEDISRLVYLQCILKETVRLHPTTPFLLPRQVKEEVELCGYTIPKNSQVLVSAWAIGRNPMLWKNPLSFQPERFMDSKIDVSGHDYELIPFGAGRRMCPGLPFAMRMMPVMLGSLINCFDWELEGGIAPEELNMEEKVGITLAKLHPLRAVATGILT